MVSDERESGQNIYLCICIVYMCLCMYICVFYFVNLSREVCICELKLLRFEDIIGMNVCEWLPV